MHIYINIQNILLSDFHLLQNKMCLWNTNIVLPIKAHLKDDQVHKDKCLETAERPYHKNAHVKYQSSNIHCLKVISKV